MVAMGGAVFYDNDITTVTVKAGVGQLGFRTFWENPLTTVISESITPPTITTGGNEETFAPDRSTIDLIIPSGTSGAYVTNSGALWTGFNTVTEDPVLGITNRDLASEVSLFATSNELKLTSPESIQLNSFTIYNAAGATLANKNVSEGNIDISYLTSGFYVLMLTSDKGDIVKRFVK